MVGVDVIVRSRLDDRDLYTGAERLRCSRKDDALARLKFQQINNQFAFCTEAALSYLTFDSSYTVGGADD